MYITELTQPRLRGRHISYAPNGTVGILLWSALYIQSQLQGRYGALDTTRNKGPIVSPDEARLASLLRPTRPATELGKRIFGSMIKVS